MRNYILALMLVCHSVYGWWPSVHKIAADIAYRNLTEEAREKVDALIQVMHTVYPSCDTFSNASNWADEVKYLEGLHLFDTLHFTNIPHDPNFILSSSDLEQIVSQQESHDVVWVIEEAIKTISQDKATPFTKALALVLLIHTVADIHQPLHCCSFHSEEFPKGDRGGNLYSLNEGEIKNLHQYWDSCLGLFSLNEDQAKIDSMVEYLMNKFPSDYFKGCLHLSEVKNWSRESQNIAVHHAYTIPIGSIPDGAYKRVNQRIALERVALSGYRLAQILNEAFCKKN